MQFGVVCMCDSNLSDFLIIMRINIFKSTITIFKVLLMYLISKHTTTEVMYKSTFIRQTLTFSKKNSHLFDKTLSSKNLLLWILAVILCTQSFWTVMYRNPPHHSINFSFTTQVTLLGFLLFFIFFSFNITFTVSRSF